MYMREYMYVTLCVSVCVCVCVCVCVWEREREGWGKKEHVKQNEERESACLFDLLSFYSLLKCTFYVYIQS